MARFFAALVVLGALMAILPGCAAGEVSEGAAMDRQQEIEEGNRRLGVEDYTD